MDVKNYKPKTLAGWITRLLTVPRPLAEEWHDEAIRRQFRAGPTMPSIHAKRVAISSAWPRIPTMFDRRAW